MMEKYVSELRRAANTVDGISTMMKCGDAFLSGKYPPAAVVEVLWEARRILLLAAKVIESEMLKANTEK